MWIGPSLQIRQVRTQVTLGTLRERGNIAARMRSNTDSRTPRIPQCSDIFDYDLLEIHLEYSIRIRPVFPAYSN